MSSQVFYDWSRAPKPTTRQKMDAWAKRIREDAELRARIRKALLEG